MFNVPKSTEVIDSPEKSARFFRRIWDKELISDQEQVYAIFVDDELKPIKWPCLHTGGVCKTILDVKVILKYAFKLNASGVFIAHNHPRGGLKPSAVDISMTNKVIDGCKLFDIKFYDHIILTSKDYTSFRETGLID